MIYRLSTFNCVAQIFFNDKSHCPKQESEKHISGGHVQTMSCERRKKCLKTQKELQIFVIAKSFFLSVNIRGTIHAHKKINKQIINKTRVVTSAKVVMLLHGYVCLYVLSVCVSDYSRTLLYEIMLCG